VDLVEEFDPKKNPDKHATKLKPESKCGGKKKFEIWRLFSEETG
jgi:hypothetical protein